MVKVLVYQSPDPEAQRTTGVADDELSRRKLETEMGGDEEPSNSDESEGEGDDEADVEEQHPIRNRSGSELESTQDDDYINTSVGVASDHLGGDQSDQKVLPSSSSSLLAKDVKTKKKKKKKGEKQKTEKKEKKKGEKQKTEKKKKKEKTQKKTEKKEKKKEDKQKKEKKKGSIDYDSENELWIGLEQGLSTEKNEPKSSIEEKQEENQENKEIQTQKGMGVKYWLAWKEKACTHKGIIMLASFGIFLFFAANIVLIVLLAS